MKKAIIAVIVLAMFGWAVYDFAISTNETANELNNSSTKTTPPSSQNGGLKMTDEVGLSPGNIAPDFKLKNMKGKAVRLSDFRGEPVIVNFWATWCPPCRAEIPDLRKLYKNKNVEILAVNLTSTEQSIGDVKKFVQNYKMSFPVLKDTESKVAEQYNVRAYPTSYMIDASGHITYMHLGAMNYDLMIQQLAKMN
ncbi:peroxiredoxin family protein [Virgibacillus ihumii]|uniref:peroxiredoxin family protein n=1 Tax=Virgibacillus ihumii TaxID=2686091 RepID=UPI00157E0914|nr:TlpA disulfide reductase family protein [Virgibacillus ihumii]